MRSLGICIGTATLQAVELTRNNGLDEIIATRRIVHDGNPGKVLAEFLYDKKFGTADRIALTGRAFRKSVALSSIAEPEAVEQALAATYTSGSFPRAVVSSGAETQLVYTVTSTGGIGGVHSGNKCASGSGEFFLQQVRRMGMSLDEAVRLALAGEPYTIAGRCSVFCKSDCTHALNKGEPRENVIAGLCRMMAEKIADLVKNDDCRHVAFIGGGALNTALTEMLKERFDTVDVPEPAGCFEAYGAALWAQKNICRDLPSDREQLVAGVAHSFGEHAPLAAAGELVEFKENVRGILQSGDQCVLGLDVGSTTTKAVLIRAEDNIIIASVYLRTDGDPVTASRNCYRGIHEQLPHTDYTITGIGVTGSGRQIAALHALTENVINEIIAHATAAAYFDKDVDTIFEIGGQDAKYTYLTAGVASDYAMNEACSAGTGSFLEEAARESLNVRTEDIADAAIKGKHPPNFTDQCAAFIGSDIKRAGQEGIRRDDILAGLVYSICLNYINRVKGSREVGKKIFMQGGTCYNRAVPLAMASLMNRPIIVPPDPGLMGAYGVALEVVRRIASAEQESGSFDLKTLINRSAERESSFICNGGSEKCDRKCSISRIRLEGKLYPFGGACNRYYTLCRKVSIPVEELDLIAARQRMLFEEFGAISGQTEEPHKRKKRKTVGIMRSFLTHSLFPLYSHFFDRLGFSIVVADKIDKEGIARAEAAFCLPAEIAHGSFHRLLTMQPDYIFIPHIMQIPVSNVPTYSRACIFVQGDSYYLKTTFRKELEERSITILNPVLRMDTSYEVGCEPMTAMALSLGIDEKRAKEAFLYACSMQKAFDEKLVATGKTALEKLDRQPDTSAIVLFGRPYNAFTDDANMGIPHKIASRGTMVLPHDMLPASEYKVDKKMFWAMGQKIMKSAQLVRKRKNLFGCYITNFSCGPDSFLLGYFRRVMGSKPSLTLELDQHTADAGIDTRIEAALSIMGTYFRRPPPQPKLSVFRAAKVSYGDKIQVISSQGRKLPLHHHDVELLLPSMGKYGTEALAATLRSFGINARALPVSDKEVLREGRTSTSCKECLPYILTTGSFMHYIRQRKDSWKVTLFFLPTGGGPCRLGQYCRALEQLIEKQQIENAAVFILTDENGYAGLGNKLLLRAWQAIVVSDVIADIRSTLSVAAKDRDNALATLEDVWKEIITWFEGRLSVRLATLLGTVVMQLKSIPLRKPPSGIPVVSLIGEIFVRRDEFSRKNIVDYMEEQGFAIRVAPVAEYLCYSNYVVNNGLGERQFTFKQRMRMKLVARIQEWWESRIKSIFAQSDCYQFEMIDVAETVHNVQHLLNVNFRGETILTLGLGMREILNDSCGILSIGPFGCMPSRMSEAMLKKEMNAMGKARISGWEKKARHYSDTGDFPFLSIETDGSPFPQLVEANLEAFVLQAKRLHKRMSEVKKQRTQKRLWRRLPVTIYEQVLGNSTLRKKDETRQRKTGTSASE